jgi:hypothetical protein
MGEVSNEREIKDKYEKLKIKFSVSPILYLKPAVSVTLWSLYILSFFNNSYINGGVQGMTTFNVIISVHFANIFSLLFWAPV